MLLEPTDAQVIVELVDTILRENSGLFAVETDFEKN